MFIGLRAFAWLCVCVGAFGVVAVFWADPGATRPSAHAPRASAAAVARSSRPTAHFPAVWNPAMGRPSRSGRRQAASNVFATPAAITSAGLLRATPAGFHFAPYQRYFVGEALPMAIAVGDVSGDKRNDVIVANGQGWMTPSGPHEVWVFRQAADGTLLAPDKYDFLAWTQHAGLALGDLNEDGVLDIVVGHDDGVTTLVHDGDGFVVTLKETPVEGVNVGVLDVDRDGHLDVLAQSWSSDASLFLGDGLGGLAARSIVDTPAAGYNDLKIGDANGDGIDDVVITNAQGFRRAYVMTVSPQGGFLPVQPIDLSTTNDFAYANALIDVDGDARKDLALAMGQTGVVKIFRQGADGAIATTSTLQLPAPGEPGVLVAADLDNNFTVDLVVLHNRENRAGYMLRNGAAFGQEVSLQGFGEGMIYEGDALAIGDIDGNGCKDLVIADYANVTVYRGQGCLKRPVAQRGPARANP